VTASPGLPGIVGRDTPDRQGSLGPRPFHGTDVTAEAIRRVRPVIVDCNPRKGSDARWENPGRSRRLAVEAATRLCSLTGNGAARTGTCHSGTSRTGSTSQHPAGRINGVNPGYREDPVPQGIPDPPRKPDPPGYFPVRHISTHLAITLPAGNSPEAATRQHGPEPAGIRG